MDLQEQLQNLFLLLQALEPLRTAVGQFLQVLFLGLDFVTFWLGYL